MGIDIISGISISITVSVSTLALINLYNTLNLKTSKTEKEVIENDTNTILKFLPGQKVNVIDLMLKNVAELREYYVISKIQATRSFTAALIMSILGVVIYLIGLAAVIILKVDVIIISIIAGTIVEAVSGLTFWLYSQSIKQLNLYHNRLASTEKYLTAIQLIEMVPEDKKYEEYRNIINFILSDNKEEIQSMKLV